MDDAEQTAIERRARATRRLAVALSAALLAVACGPARLPPPRYVAQPTSALRAVPFPPPPARAEWVPPAPRAGGAVWIDGEWTWQGRRWAWRAGRWVLPPANARYAPWTSVRDAHGNVYVAEGGWRDDAGRAVPEPPALAVGRSSPGAIVTRDGRDVAVGPAAPASGSRAPRAARPAAR